MCLSPIMQISGSLGTMSEVGTFPQLTSWNSPPAATDSENSEKGDEFGPAKRFRTGGPADSHLLFKESLRRGRAKP